MQGKDGLRVVKRDTSLLLVSLVRLVVAPRARDFYLLEQLSDTIVEEVNDGGVRIGCADTQGCRAVLANDVNVFIGGDQLLDGVLKSIRAGQDESRVATLIDMIHVGVGGDQLLDDASKTFTTS